MMLVFALLLLVITVLRLSGASFALMPLAGNETLLPISLIVIATICMTWTLRHWTTVSRRRALLSLVISLSATLITALACLEGMSRREGVFLRTSKTGSSHHRLRTAIRLCRREALLSVSLYTSAVLIALSSHPPLLLIFVISLQGTVYACAPIASLWNLRAQLVPTHEFRRRFEERRLRQSRRRRPSFRVAGLTAALLLALVVATTTAVLAAPDRLLPGGAVDHGRVVRP
jgi:hypothetical protein